LRVSRTGAPTLWRSPRQFPLLSICGQGAQRLRPLHLTPYEKIRQVDREAGRVCVGDSKVLSTMDQGYSFYVARIAVRANHYERSQPIRLDATEYSFRKGRLIDERSEARPLRRWIGLLFQGHEHVTQELAEPARATNGY
jgi:hypothetical protein